MATRTVQQHKPAQKKKRRKGAHKSGFSRLLRYLPGWPKCLGAAIVLLTGWLLIRLILSNPVSTAYTPPKQYPVRGIDVSHHQGVIDWELLRNQATIGDLPLSFAFIKATEGCDIVDSRFARNFSEAKKHGIMRGAYHFYRTSSPAKDQAEHFISHVKLEAGDLPPVLDVEVKPDDVPAEAFRQGILEWLLRVEQHYGVRPILYTYHSFRQQYMRDSIFNLYPYWIAHYYVDSVRYRGHWHFWQHSDRGELPGIKGQVDLDVFNGDYAALQRMTIE